MIIKTFEDPAAFMVHDLGPQRYYKKPDWMARWSRTKLGKALLAVMATHGLDHRDIYLGQDVARADVVSDAGRIRMEKANLTAHRPELDALFARLAAGVAQERMMRIAGWQPGDQLPFWAVTASDVLVCRARSQDVRPAQVWNAGVHVEEDGWIDRPAFYTTESAYDYHDPRTAFPADCYITRYGTGMHLTWRDEGLEYRENCQGATFCLPTVFLNNVGSELVGRRLADVCTVSNPLIEAVAKYQIVDAFGAEGADGILGTPHCTILRLAVPMRTLEPIPDDVLVSAGVAQPTGHEQDYPFWMLTPPALLLRYRPRLG